MRTLLLLLLSTCVGVAIAADAASDFKQAMSGNDANDKKKAIASLASSGLDDEVVLPLLISAVGDRQAGRYAIPALRQRTGLTPSARRGENSGYPGYPATDDASGWQSWLSDRKKAASEQEKLEEALATAEEAKEKAEEAITAVTAVDLDGDGTISEAEQKASAEADADGDGILSEEEQAAAAAALAAATSADPEAELPEHLQPEPATSKYGKLDRLFFTDGSILRCYVVTKRTDLEGKLTSVKIIHKDGGGEEIIDAAVLARIEEDIQ